MQYKNIYCAADVKLKFEHKKSRTRRDLLSYKDSNLDRQNQNL
jgi:hypothetical protein